MRTALWGVLLCVVGSVIGWVARPALTGVTPASPPWLAVPGIESRASTSPSTSPEDRLARLEIAIASDPKNVELHKQCIALMTEEWTRAFGFGEGLAAAARRYAAILPDGPDRKAAVQWAASVESIMARPVESRPETGPTVMPRSTEFPNDIDRTELDTACLEVRRSRDEPDRQRRTKLLRSVLDRTSALRFNASQSMDLWRVRAIAAIECQDVAAGVEAGDSLIRLGARRTTDASMRALLAELNLRKWLPPETRPQTSAAEHIAVLEDALFVEKAWCDEIIEVLGRQTRTLDLALEYIRVATAQCKATAEWLSEEPESIEYVSEMLKRDDRDVFRTIGEFMDGCADRLRNRAEELDTLAKNLEERRGDLQRLSDNAELMKSIQDARSVVTRTQRDRSKLRSLRDALEERAASRSVATESKPR
jgi:hypothetical protein